MKQLNYSGELIQDLIEENVFLVKLVDTIPVNMYFDKTVQEKIISDKHLTMDKKAESLKRRFSVPNEISASNKHKRAKLDPLCQKSVSQIHQEFGKNKQKRNKKTGLLLSSSSLTRAANIEDLRKRLQEHVDELQMKRKGGKTVVVKKIQKKRAALVRNEGIMRKVLPKQKKPVAYNKQKLSYSKLEFSNDLHQNQRKRANYKILIKKAEEKKQQHDILKRLDPLKAGEVEKQEKWKRAILKSKNIKLKDDLELLRKSLKKQAKIKRKKAEVWKKRVENKENAQKARQEKRLKNIGERRNKKKKYSQKNR